MEDDYNTYIDVEVYAEEWNRVEWEPSEVDEWHDFDPDC